MNRLITIVASTVVAGLVGSNLPARAQPDNPRVTGEDRVRRAARTAIGHIEGLVLDDRGAPLQGVTVSALGSSNASTVTDKRGSFVLRSLQPGSYLVRAQRPGYIASRRQLVQVAGPGATRFSVTLQRDPGGAPRLLAAGMGPGADPLDVGDDDPPSGTTGNDPGETAWRLRHLRRSILKEAERAALEGASEPPASGIQPGTLAFIAKAMGSPVRLLGDLPFSGEVHFLTSGSFDTSSSLLSSTVPLRQVAFVSLGGPAWRHGDWSAQVMGQGDLGSWFLAGAYRKRAPASHLYDIGVSYSTQRFTPGSRWPIALGSEGTRSAGAIYGTDHWTLSPRVTLDYGARYARYDYLGSPGLFSPRASLTLVPLDGFRVRGTVSRRMLAPGAEEFLEPLVSGLWVPPERTFLGFTPLTAEGTNHYEVSVERDLTSRFVLTFRGFYQVTQDQQVAVFGLSPTPAGETGHYVVGNTGDVTAQGWSLGLSNAILPHVRGSVLYTLTNARWQRGTASDYGLLLVGSGARPPAERLNDLTTAVEADIPFTATRVYLAYRLNSAFARRDADTVKPGADARFDVQVLQRLPFLDFTSARWQVMFAVRNLFRDPASDASVYDELLVVRPPKRVVTGLLVRF